MNASLGYIYIVLLFERQTSAGVCIYPHVLLYTNYSIYLPSVHSPLLQTGVVLLLPNQSVNPTRYSSTV